MKAQVLPDLANALWMIIAPICLAQMASGVEPSMPVPGSEPPIPFVVSPVIGEYKALSSSIDRIDKKLIALINDESAADADRVFAMRALGRFHSPHAELPLLNQLLFSQGDVTRPRPLDSYPAAEALTNYARHLYEAAWAAVDRKRSDDYLYVLAVTFVVMDGEEVAIIRVEDWLDQPGATPAQIDNFRKVLRFLKQTDFNDPRNWPRNGDPNPTD